MAAYEIRDQRQLDAHITFLRIVPKDIALTLSDILESLSDLSWLSRFDQDYVRNGFAVRAAETINYISNNILNSTDDAVTSDSGEYVVSELARKAIVTQLKYLDIPLAELIKEKAIGNHGFDFYTRNLGAILLFGEAKYNARQNAYGLSFKQIVKFESQKQDSSDVLDIDRFCCEDSKHNFSKGEKGFIAAFASKKTDTDSLIAGIKNNADYQKISAFKELICVAVDV